jgi:hypothetical protein
MQITQKREKVLNQNMKEFTKGPCVHIGIEKRKIQRQPIPFTFVERRARFCYLRKAPQGFILTAKDF